MITKKQDAQPRPFKGVNSDLLATGPQSMVTKMHYVVGAVVPLHSHPHEQAGYIVSGSYRLQIGDRKEILNQCDSYAVPAGVLHGIKVFESGEVVDVFTPPREDYR